MTDLYTKSVLTVIAGTLVWIAAVGVPVPEYDTCGTVKYGRPCYVELTHEVGIRGAVKIER
jgi:hypothetical protein